MGGAIFLIFLLLVGGGATYLTVNHFSQSTGLEDTESKVATGSVTGTLAGSTCPDTLKKVYSKAIDNEAIPALQVAGTVYVYDKSNKQVGSDALSATAGTWSSGYQGCLQDGKIVYPTLRGLNGGNTSASVDFDLGFGDVYSDALSVKQISPLEIRIKDANTDAYLYLVQGATTSTNVTTYTNINNTYARPTQASTSNISVATGGVLSLKVYAKANTARRYFGDPALKTYLCIDEGTASGWSAPSVSIGGSLLSDVKGTLSANNGGNDGRYSSIANSEYCYEVGAFTNAEKVIDISIPAVGGVNPAGADDTITLYFLPQGVFRSVKADTINQPLTGVVTDASTQALVATPSLFAPNAVVLVG